jgi:hypothetical protein
MSRSQITQRKLMDAVTVDGATTYSSSRKFHNCAGDATLHIISTAGTLAISQQCSMNDVDWYDPVNTSDSALGVVKAAQTVTTGVYVVFTPVISKFVRFKVVESSASTDVTLTLSYRLEV